MPSDGGKTWTYKMRKGVKYEDGTAITSQGRQVRRAARRWTSDVLANGPTYFDDFLDLKGYKGPYKDKGMDTTRRSRRRTTRRSSST